MAHGQLTAKQKSCLLRVTRHRLQELNDAYQAASEHGDIGGTTADEFFDEISCVTEAIRWLWLQPTVDK